MTGFPLKTPSMTDFKPGNVVLVPFPFTDLSQSKPRPALILGSEKICKELPDIILCQITSRILRYTNPSLGDVPLNEWKEAGLLLPSTVRLVKLATLSKEKVLAKLGTLTNRDMERVLSTFSTIFLNNLTRK